MLEACPVGHSPCIVSGGAFCVTHEADDPFVQRAIADGETIWDIHPVSHGRSPRKPAKQDADGETSGCSICHKPGHLASACPRRDPVEEAQEADDG